MVLHYYSSSARDALHVTSAPCRELWNIAKRQGSMERVWRGARNSRSAAADYYYMTESARAAVKERENLPRNFGRANTDFTVDVSRREMSPFFLPALWIIISSRRAERCALSWPHDLFRAPPPSMDRKLEESRGAEMEIKTRARSHDDKHLRFQSFDRSCLSLYPPPPLSPPSPPPPSFSFSSSSSLSLRAYSSKYHLWTLSFAIMKTLAVCTVT